MLSKNSRKIYRFQLENFRYIWYSIRVDYRKDQPYTMNIKTFFKKLLADTSIYFTLITAVYALLMLIAHVGEDAVAMEAYRLLLFFVFSVLAALAAFLLRLPRWHGALRITLHFAILAMAFYLCFLVPASMRASGVLIGLFAFAVIYWIGAAIVALFVSRFRKNAEQDVPYTKQYQKRS